MRIAKSQHAMADDHGHNGIATAATAIERRHCGKEIGRRDARRADALQFRGQHIQQHFGIGIGVEVAAVFANDYFGEFPRIGQVAVVPEANAVRRVDIERLRFGSGIAARGRIAHMPDADIAAQFEHGILTENVTNQTSAFMLV